MATYYDIFGQKVQYLASDPSPVAVGQVWYNSTSNTAKVQGYSAGTWSSGGNMSYNMGDGGMTRAGTITAALVWQGAPQPSTGLNKTESYDGTTWTGKPNTPYAASGVGSFGTQTAAVGAGGQPGGGGVTTTIEWNGSAWGSGGALPYANLYQFGGAGPATDGILIGGYSQTPPNVATTDVKVYNGTAWSTDSATAPFGMYAGQHYGLTSNSCNMLGGYGIGTPNVTNDHAGYNGTAFTNLTVYPTITGTTGVFGDVNNAYAYGGIPYTSAGNTWDGSAWTSATAYPVNIQYSYSCGLSGSSTSGLNSGGTLPGYTNATNEFSGIGPKTETITTT